MANSERRFDVTIIGSGPGGYVAAVRAGQLGLKTAVVEEQAQPGGTCLHWGCIPTKAMLNTAHVLETTRHAATFGVQVAEGKLDLKAMHRYKAKTVDGNVKGIEYLFKKNKITLVPGRGRLAGPGRVEVAQAEGRRVLIKDVWQRR